MEWGKQAEWFESLARAGHAVPALERRPALEPGLEFIWTAFFDLSRDRSPSPLGLGSIPFHAIDRYAERYAPLVGDFESFHLIIKTMDAAFLKWKPPETPHGSDA